MSLSGRCSHWEDWGVWSWSHCKVLEGGVREVGPWEQGGAGLLDPNSSLLHGPQFQLELEGTREGANQSSPITAASQWWVCLHPRVYPWELGWEGSLPPHTLTCCSGLRRAVGWGRAHH